jgi:integrase
MNLCVSFSSSFIRFAAKIAYPKHALFDHSSIDFVPFASLMREWLRGKLKIKKGTRATYDWLIENHIIPSFEGKAVNEVTSTDIENVYINWQDNETLCGDNLRKCHTLIKAAFKRAVGLGMIVMHPADHVEAAQADATEMLYWTPEESHRFLKHAEKDRYYMAFFLALTTGMRQGEILGLTQKSTNTKNRTIAVRQILEHDGKELDPRTKTDSGVRSVGMDKVTAAELTN